MTKSGFCSTGHHEGGRYPGPVTGKLNKTCSLVETCTCDNPTCHIFFNKMFQEAGLPRQVVDNSGYEPELNSFTFTKPVIVAAAPILSTQPLDNTPNTLESVAPGIVPPRNRASYGPTNSGRAARGQLEDQVNDVCSTWTIENYPLPCTPQYISFEIGRLEGIKQPSTGAISSVFDRWEKIGYAVIERKPTRFVKFSEEAINLGLTEMKKKAKREEGTKKSAIRRGEKV